MSERGSQAISISAAFTAIAGITVLLRLYTRFFIVRCAGLEDYSIIGAMLFSIGLTICIGVQVIYGMGKHIETLDGETMRTSLKAFWVSLIVYYLSLGLIKTSLLLQYQRVFQTRKFQWACHGLMVFVFLYTVWTIFGSIFACYPVRAFWTKEPATCLNQSVMWFTNAGLNIAQDLAIIMLPMPVIRSLNLRRRQKQALIGIFAIGGFVCIVSILRLQSLIAISNSSDPTYDNPPAATWSSVEINVGIICSCLPILRPLVSRYLPRVFPSSYKGGGYTFSANRTHRGVTTYGHQTWHSITALENVSSSKHSKSRSHDEGIQVTTTVNIKVQDGEELRKEVECLQMAEKENSRQGSTETLVNAPGAIV